MIHNCNVSKKSDAKDSMHFHPYGDILKKQRKLEEARKISNMSEERKQAEATFAKIKFKAMKSIEMIEKPKDKWFKLGEVKHG